MSDHKHLVSCSHLTQSALFTVLVAVLFITPSPCHSPDSSTHCATLSVYAQEAELYSTSNTTMVFLPGDHFLDKNIKVASVDRLIMLGKSSSEAVTQQSKFRPIALQCTSN